MKNKYFLLLFFAAFCCMGVQCKEEEPDKIEELAKLPPATTKGRNTIGCLINGKAWPMSSEGFHRKQVFYGDRLFINYETLFSQFDLNESISIMSKLIKTEGTHTITFSNPDNEFIIVNYEGDKFSSDYSPNKDGFAIIKIIRLDSLNHILSGSFNFTLKNSSGKKQITVEHGRFDYQYQ